MTINMAGGHDVGKSQDFLSYVRGGVSYGKEFSNGSDLMLSLSYYNNNGQVMYIPYFTGTGEGAVADKKDFNRLGTFMFTYRNKGFSIFSNSLQSNTGNVMASYWAIPDSDKNEYKYNDYYFGINYEYKLNEEISNLTRVFYDDTQETNLWYYDMYPLDIEEVPITTTGIENRFSWTTQNSHFLVGLVYNSAEVSEIENYPSEEYYKKTVWNYTDHALYLQENLELTDKFSFNISGRYQGHQYFDPTIVTRGDLIYQHLQSTFKLQIGEAFMNPSLTHFFYHSLVLDADQNVVRKLHGEKITTTEFVWMHNIPDSLRSNFTIFNNHIRDKIKYRTSEDLYFNGGGINTNGVELSLNFSVFYNQRGYINSTYQESTDVDTDEIVENFPRYSIKFGSVYDYLPFNKFKIALEGQHYGKADYTDNEDRPGVDLKQDAYTIFNLNISSKKVFNSIDVSFGIYNLLNQSYEYDVTKNTGGSLPGNGRNFNLKMSHTF